MELTSVCQTVEVISLTERLLSPTETITIHQMVFIMLFFIFTMALTVTIFIYR